MFDGVVPEQFHQFISSLPLSFNPPLFDSSEFQLQQQLQLHQHYPSVLQEEKEEEAKRKDKLHSIEAAASNHQHEPPCSKDELLSLLRIRSGMDTNWFPDLSNWDHVSRKLGELGIERSGQKCKEKFEEETTQLMSCSTNNINELQKLCGSVNPDPKVPDKNDHHLLDPKTRHEEEEEEEEVKKTEHRKKRKRDGDDEHYHHQKVEMLKSFCEEVVNKMMSLQEDLHEKILQEMVKRDNEKIVREEAWKKQDMERFEKEFQFRSNQQAIASDRHAKLIQILNSFTTITTTNANATPQNPNLLTMRACVQEQNPSAMPNQNPLTTSSSSTEGLPSSKNPVKQKPRKPIGIDGDHEDIGKRWPKEQVHALINLRCSIVMSGSSTFHDQQEKELLGAKGPLWERISRGMLEMGYKRSAKRCKEKWENINKYFRKTKDNGVNKKRSLESRTCPYFHQLNTLYSQGKLGMPPVEDTLLPPESQSSGNLETIPAQPPVDDNVEGGQSSDIN